MTEVHELPTAPPTGRDAISVASDRAARTAEIAPRWPRLIEALWARPEKSVAALLLLAILGIVAAYKLRYTASVFDPDVDGGYYLDIAKHVRDGYGLVTSVSLRHKGYPYFPHPTEIYPLWPLTLGILAKVFPLREAGRWVPTVLYFVSLVLGYLWANRVYRRPLLGRWLPWFRAGHVFVILFAINRNFFQMTSKPHNEALGFTLLLFVLWRMARAVPRPTVLAGLEMGLFAALLMLARTPLVLFFMACIPSLLFSCIAASGARLAYLRMLGGCLLGFSLLLAVRVLHLASFIPDFELSHVLRWDEVQFTNLLSHPTVLRASPDLASRIDRTLEGFRVAFAWGGEYAYKRQFYTAHYALALVLPILAFQGLCRIRPKHWRSGLDWLERPKNQYWVLLLVFASGAFLSMHVLHRFSGWYFQRRHCLPAFFLIFMALMHLFQSGIVGRIVGLATLASSLWVGGSYIHDTTVSALAQADRREREADLEPAVVKWLRDQASKDPDTLIVAMRQPGRIAWRTEGIGFHHFDGRMTIKDVETLVTHFGVDYVLVPTTEKIRFATTPAFKRYFKYQTTRSKHRIYIPTEQLTAKRVVRTSR